MPTSTKTHKPANAALGRPLHFSSRHSVPRPGDFTADARVLMLMAIASTSGRRRQARQLVGHLADRMAENGIGRVPVLDAAGRLAGLVARKDLLAARARRVAEERDRVRLLVRQRAVRKAPKAKTVGEPV